MSETPRRVRLFKVTSGDKRDFYTSMTPGEESNQKNDAKASEWISAAALRELCEQFRETARQSWPEEEGAIWRCADDLESLLEGK